MSDRLDFYVEHARALRGLPPNWKAYKRECVPLRGKTVGVLLTGACCDAVREDGGTDWDKCELSTEATVLIDKVAHDNFVRDWELRTGFCSECQGIGKTVASFGVNGTTYRQCFKCGGNGKAKL